MDASAFTGWQHESGAWPTPLPDHGFQFAVPSPGAAPTHLPFAIGGAVVMRCAVSRKSDLVASLVVFLVALPLCGCGDRLIGLATVAKTAWDISHVQVD